MVAASRGLEKWRRAASAAAWVSSSSWSWRSPSPPAPTICPFSSRRTWTLRFPLVSAREASCSTRRSSWLRSPWSTATSGLKLATMSVGSSSGSRKTGTMMRATFVVPSRFNLSARPVFCTISTCEPRVSAKDTASTPRSPVMSTPSPRTRQLARKARCTRRPAASICPFLYRAALVVISGTGDVHETVTTTLTVPGTSVELAGRCTRPSHRITADASASEPTAPELTSTRRHGGQPARADRVPSGRRSRDGQKSEPCFVLSATGPLQLQKPAAVTRCPLVHVQARQVVADADGACAVDADETLAVIGG